MTSRNKEKLLALALFLVGIALCGAGFVVAPLAVIGGAFIAGSLTVLANALQNKEVINLNNNYTLPNFSIPENKPIPKSYTTQSPIHGIKTLFGFKNKRFMRHHEALQHPERESEAMELPSEVVIEIAKLRDVLKKLTTENKSIDEIAQNFQTMTNDNGPSKE